MRIHRQLHRKSPAKLDDLVTTGILPELPLDPYAGKPFGYLREKQLIWSVGQSGDNQPQDEDPSGIAEVDIARRQWRFSDLPPANQ